MDEHEISLVRAFIISKDMCEQAGQAILLIIAREKRLVTVEP
jgi:hypothetical protein